MDDMGAFAVKEKYHSSVPELVNATLATKFVNTFKGTSYARYITTKDGNAFYCPAGWKNKQGIRSRIPYTPNKAIWHLHGSAPLEGVYPEKWEPVKHGMYPMVMRNTYSDYSTVANDGAWWVAADIDNHGTGNKKHTVKKLIKMCWKVVEAGLYFNLPVYLELSGGGKGIHLWMFSAECLPASHLIRLLYGLVQYSNILTETEVPTKHGKGTQKLLSIKGSPEATFDKFFPAQDTVPEGHYGNLIALPYNGEAKWKTGKSAMLEVIDDKIKVVPLKRFLRHVRKAHYDQIYDAYKELDSKHMWKNPPGTRNSIDNAKRVRVIKKGLKILNTNNVDWFEYLTANMDVTLVTEKTATINGACPYCSVDGKSYVSLTTGWLECWRMTCFANQGVPPSRWIQDLELKSPRRKVKTNGK